ncbi:MULTISPECIES: invasin/intimin cell-adhesion domain protein [Ralstonia solanacearum species complex]|uniref:invasin/intimin cell-adhesion domain protein n=1 Tax=Ralstonia solanacearum species complex TaxID=3116862 RepID=UPI001F09050F|nr:invasin/intimin cell-adhesion domain protein [Ralstonia solanacearum]BEU74503.1 hypothetical protein MAFF211271_40580 [Ralstonia pseudosolanacearum]
MTAPKGSKQLVSNPEFSVSDQILQGKLNDGKNDNYVSPGVDGYPPPDSWQRVAGGLRVENVLDPLMESYRSQIPLGSYNVICLAGDRTPGSANGELQQNISLERGGSVTLNFFSIRNPYAWKGPTPAAYNCGTKSNQFYVSFGSENEKFVDFGDPAIKWVPRKFTTQVLQASYALVFGPAQEGGQDLVCQDCASVIAYPQMFYTYAAYAKLQSPQLPDDIQAAPGEAFPEIDVVILEGNNEQYSDAPGTTLPNSVVVFQLVDPGDTGTQFEDEANPARYQTTANDSGVAIIPAGKLVAGQKPGNVTLQVTVADDVAATFPAVVHADYPPDGEEVTVLNPSNGISMNPLSEYDDSIVFQDAIPNQGGVRGKLIHVEIRQNGQLVDDPNAPYFDTGTGHVFQWQGTTGEEGRLETPNLWSGAQSGKFQVFAYLDGYPKRNAPIELDVVGVDHVNPANPQVTAIRNTDVVDYWTVTALDSNDKPATAQRINFTIVQGGNVDATFLVSGTHQAEGVSNPETGVVSVPALRVTDESGHFEIHVADGSYKSLSTIYVEVIDPQIPSLVVFDDAPPDLKNAAGTILKEGKIGVYVYIGNPNPSGRFISGRLGLSIEDTHNTGTTFNSGSPLNSYADIIDGYAKVPEIKLGGNPGTFTILATVDAYGLHDALPLQIG